MGELSIRSRARVDWGPGENVDPGAEDIRSKVVIVLDGPFTNGAILPRKYALPGKRHRRVENQTGGSVWVIRPKGLWNWLMDRKVIVSADFLTPTE